MKSRKKLTPLQILLLVVLFIGIVLLNQYLGPGTAGENPEPPPGDPEVVVNLNGNTGAESTISASAISALTENQLDNFDYFILSLSWSPDYCATDGENDVQQCAVGRKLGFVLHGLWPNYTRGYPSYCTEEKLPQELEDQFNGLFPSDKLYDHEWEKHGTCSGLSPENYLLASQQLKATTIIPDAYQAPEAPFRTTSQELQAEFASSNPDFSESSVAVYCSGSGRFLKEIFVCYANDGSPTVCSAEVQSKAAKSCGQPDFLVRNIR
jgi:ribonuclease T2